MNIHVLVTAAWCIGALALGFRNGLLELEANLVGDFLAGVAAPAAFYWLVVGYYLQREELKLQREELKLTRTELSRQAEAQELTAKLQAENIASSNERFEKEKLIEDMKEIKDYIWPILKYAYGPTQLFSNKLGQTVGWFGGDDPSEHKESVQSDAFRLIRTFRDWNTDKFGSAGQCFRDGGKNYYDNMIDATLSAASWYRRRRAVADLIGFNDFKIEAERMGLPQLINAINELHDTEESWL